ncbi:hypothetical protein B0H14DRAFT_936868 [Mycena olivaceomarginata]|nr:hypothetical protein B0H14DRAFT_936868 [Mycena olivaceomarginata]
MHDISDVEPGEVYVDLVGLLQNDTHSAVTDAEVNETLSLFDADQPGIATLPPNATLPYFSVNYRPISAGAKSACSLVVGRAISCGRLWDVFEGVLVQDTAASDASVLRAELDRGVYNSTEQPAAPTSVLNATSQTIPVVVKFVPRHQHHRLKCQRGRGIQMTTSSAYTSAEIARAVQNEADLYHGPLQGLQGTVVPVCYGFWEGTIQVHTNFQEQRRGIVDVWMFVLENLGADVSASAVAAEWGDLHDLYFEPIIDLYRALHAARVVHNDLELRHIRHLVSGPPKCLRLIDFERGESECR